MEGTYPLPEAQLDRFLFKLKVRYPSAENLHTILDRTTSATVPRIQKVLGNASEVMELREVVREVPLARDIQDFAVQLVLATHPEHAQSGTLAARFVRYGASPRGAQALVLAGKIHAVLDGRYHVAKADIANAALSALRHRVILNFEAEAEGQTSDAIINEILHR
jgi:MoxR-like ATPase